MVDLSFGLSQQRVQLRDFPPPPERKNEKTTRKRRPHGVGEVLGRRLAKVSAGLSTCRRFPLGGGSFFCREPQAVGFKLFGSPLSQPQTGYPPNKTTPSHCSIPQAVGFKMFGSPSNQPQWVHIWTKIQSDFDLSGSNAKIRTKMSSPSKKTTPSCGSKHSC